MAFLPMARWWLVLQGTVIQIRVPFVGHQHVEWKI